MLNMKRFISLIAALAVSVSSFMSLATVASADTAPRVVVSATEVDFTDPAYTAYAGGDCDWREYCDETYTYKTYDVEVKLTGIELATESYKSGKTTKYRGTSLITALANFDVVTTGDRDDTWTSAVISTLISGATNTASETKLGSSGVSAGAVYPAPGTQLTVSSSDEITIWHALVTVDTKVPVTLNLTRAGVTIANFATDLSASKSDSSVEYDTTKSNFPVAGVSLTLPLAEAPAPEPGIAPVEAVATVAEDATGLTDLNGDAVTLDADYGIAKFDTPINTGLNKYYIVAKTATETSPDFLVDFSGAVEAEGNIAFYAIVKSTHGPITSLTLKAVANE